MPGKHSARQKRQAKHIIAGYEKRGVSDKKAKSIAWATVNGEKSAKNESWMFNGAGEPVFMGNSGPVSQFNPGGSVSPGASYIPDEVAKMLVKESGLRKSDTISKRVIIGYLESMGLSAGLAVDVAKVLRDVYGLTPTFDESTLYGRSGALIEELTGAIGESFPMPFAVDDEPKILNEADIIGSFIQSEFVESNDENYDLALAHLALLSPREFCDVVDFHEWVGPEIFDYIEALAVEGDDGAAEKLVEGLCWPSRIQFMPESIQRLFDEDAASDVIRAHMAKRQGSSAASGVIKAHLKKVAQKKQMAKPVSARKQMKLLAKDNPDIQKSDPLAAKKASHDDANHGQKGKPMGAVHSDPNLGTKLNALRAKKTAEKPAPGPSAMKRAGKTAIGVMKKVGGAVKSAAHFAHTPSKANPDVGPALKKLGHGAAKVAGAVGKGAVKAVGGSLGAVAHVGGAAARGLVNGLGKKSGEKKEPKEKVGVLGHIGRAIGKFAGHVKQGFKDATPGIQSQLPKGDSEAPAKKQRVAKSAVGEAVLRSGSLLNEVSDALSGVVRDEDPEPEAEELVRSPAEVVQAFEATSVIDMAVLEAIGEMDWNSIASVAGFVMLEPDVFLSLVQSFKESKASFRSEWAQFEESGAKPEWLRMGAFLTLSKMSLDEGVVPRLVYWSTRALQAADEGVATYVAEEYPELGKTVYGPAGDPKEGPKLAKLFMTPQPSGAMTPSATDCTTRMFSDPADRDKARKDKLSDVMAALDGMRSQAASAGVAPEGMFLNLYRDMHREKVRYS